MSQARADGRLIKQMQAPENGTFIAPTLIGVPGIQAMAQEILPKYFNHTKYASFQRQLNYFGFRKWTKTMTTICTFSHRHFRRDGYENMNLITRKKRQRHRHMVKPSPLLATDAFKAKKGQDGVKNACPPNQIELFGFPIELEALVVDVPNDFDVQFDWLSTIFLPDDIITKI